MKLVNKHTTKQQHKRLRFFASELPHKGKGIICINQIFLVKILLKFQLRNLPKTKLPEPQDRQLFSGLFSFPQLTGQRYNHFYNGANLFC